MWVSLPSSRMEGLQDLSGSGELGMMTTWFGLCSHLCHLLGTQGKPPGLKLSIHFKYTVINHVTGVSPSIVCRLLA